MPAHKLTGRQLLLLDYLLRNLRRAPRHDPARIERECCFVLGYVFALETRDELRARLTALIKNATHHAQQGSPWPNQGKGVIG